MLMGEDQVGPYDRRLASLIDHTVMSPDVTTSEIVAQCRLVRLYGFAGICVNLVHVATAARGLEGTPHAVCTGVGFPLGACGRLVKAYETREAVGGGADEIDMVVNIGAVKEGDFATVGREIAAVVAAAEGKTVKVVLEICYLEDPEIREACRIAVENGAAFVKTSTGFGPASATVEGVRLMRAVVGTRAKVKAAGGIRDRAFALQLLEAGADRLGMSRSVEVVTESPGKP
jgi:deoxyribose-phosphate aldolase